MDVTTLAIASVPSELAGKRLVFPWTRVVSQVSCGTYSARKGTLSYIQGL